MVNRSFSNVKICKHCDSKNAGFHPRSSCPRENTTKILLPPVEGPVGSSSSSVFLQGRATPFFRVDLVSASPTLRVHANDDVAHAEFTLSETALPDVAATPKFYWIRWDVDNRSEGEVKANSAWRVQGGGQGSPGRTPRSGQRKKSLICATKAPGSGGERSRTQTLKIKRLVTGERTVLGSNPMSPESAQVVAHVSLVVLQERGFRRGPRDWTEPHRDVIIERLRRVRGRIRLDSGHEC